LGLGITLLVVPIYFALLLNRLNKTNKELNFISNQDELTGLPNRRAFDSKIKDEYSRLKRYPAPFALALLDVDNFKSINDMRFFVISSGFDKVTHG
jgi:PleD family two-component response regulator